MNKNDQKPDLFWAQCSFGNYSCHINGPSLMLKDSLVGTLKLNNVENVRQWNPILRDGKDLGAFDSIGRAQSALENYWRNNPTKR